MSRERFFLDTAFIQALLNPRDPYHVIAQAMLPRTKKAIMNWVTEAVLAEVADALSAVDRSEAVRFIKDCKSINNFRVVTVSQPLFSKALDLYDSRPDKTWGMTDCISFVVMQEQGLTYALTTDTHFVQAGFRALMLENI